MFLVRDNVPEVYIQESRDFQLFSELYDLAIQSSRFSIDSLEEATSSMYCNSSILPLLATKVGLFEELNLPDIAYRKAINIIKITNIITLKNPSIYIIQS